MKITVSYWEKVEGKLKRFKGSHTYRGGRIKPLTVKAPYGPKMTV